MLQAVHRRARSGVLLCGVWLAAVSCRGRSATLVVGSGGAPATVASAPTSPSANANANANAAPVQPVASAPPLAAASPAATLAASGRARLILERVDTTSECGGGFVGFDVLLEVSNGDQPPRSEHVFCPEGPHGPQPSLNMFRMCRAFPRCQIGGSDAGGSVELSCGKERVSLSSSGQRTTLSGSFGEREVAAVPMTLAVEKRWRKALVDC